MVMVNLFSVFDPAGNFGIHINWFSMMMGILIFPLLYWIVLSRYQEVWMLLIESVGQEFSSVFSKKSIGLGFLMCVLFVFIVLNNFLGLFPYVFTASSHILFTLGLALPIWVSLMIFGWVSKPNEMFAHLVPSGTPMALMAFMVCIESASNLIRPITLSVRLAANMIAGHLLIVLLGSSISLGVMKMFFGIFSLVLLLLLELAVAFIQGYVFSVLSSLYAAEVE